MLIEQRPMRYNLLVDEFEDNLIFGDGTEIWVLEKAGIGARRHGRRRDR